VGGEELSITEGVVSRVEVQRYAHSQRHLLAITIDAAINDGNSGGPVFNTEGLVVGIAFQSLEEAENIGEMVPTPLIRHFLEGIAQQKPLAIPSIGAHVQNLENPVLRRARKLKPEHSGVLVARVLYGSSAWGVLETGDVIMSILGQNIANNGTIRFHDRFRTNYGSRLCEHYVGDQIQLGILRDGEQLEVTLTLAGFQRLVPQEQYDRMPTYFIFGGLIFQPLSLNYLQSWNKWWERAPRELVYEYYRGIRSEERQSIITLTQVLSDELNVGYEDLANRCVTKINGDPPRHMSDFVKRLEASCGLVELELSSGESIVFDAAEERASSARILSRYRIDQDRSLDLR
jgi:hypothetical protein